MKRINFFYLVLSQKSRWETKWKYVIFLESDIRSPLTLRRSNVNDHLSGNFWISREVSQDDDGIGSRVIFKTKKFWQVKKKNRNRIKYWMENRKHHETHINVSILTKALCMKKKRLKWCQYCRGPVNQASMGLRAVGRAVDAPQGRQALPFSTENFPRLRTLDWRNRCNSKQFKQKFCNRFFFWQGRRTNDIWQSPVLKTLLDNGVTC